MKVVSAASLLVVCGYCRATLLRRDVDVERIGTMAALLEDRSPLQVGAEGRWRSTGFGVLGRIQVGWEHGAWNEWYCLFDDGRTGWLGEAAGEYTLTFELEAPGPLPPWSSLRPGLRLALGGVEHEVRAAQRADRLGAEQPVRVGDHAHRNGSRHRGGRTSTARTRRGEASATSST